MAEYPISSVVSMIGALTRDNTRLGARAFELWKDHPDLDPSQCVGLAGREINLEEQRAKGGETIQIFVVDKTGEIHDVWAPQDEWDKGEFIARVGKWPVWVGRSDWSRDKCLGFETKQIAETFATGVKKTLSEEEIQR